MAIGMSSGAPLLSLIMFCVLTTSYCWCFAQTSPRQSFALPRPGRRMHGLYRYMAGKLCSSAGLGMPCSKIFPKSALKSSPFQAQQRWAGRPIYPSLPLIITASYPVPVPPTTPFHRSAHRYCAWNPPLFLSPTPSSSFPSEGVEAIELINVLAEAEVLESSTFRNWKSFHAPRDMHDQKQDRRPAPSRAFSLARAVLLDSREGRGVRNCVKTSERDGLRGGRFQPGAPRCVPSITYARPKLVLATNTKAGLAIAGPGFHPVSSVPPAGTAMHFSCPSHARCRQAGEL